MQPCGFVPARLRLSWLPRQSGLRRCISIWPAPASLQTTTLPQCSFCSRRQRTLQPHVRRACPLLLGCI